MAFTPLDRDRLAQALVLAESAIGLSDPNPRVGCIIGDENGAVFGRGHTQQAGGPHAEVMALREAGVQARGATAWVTLEPCAHHGRTPPCCDALVAAGVARVVAALEDPFPAVAGAGLHRLRAAGIQVDLGDAELAQAARELNIGFFTRVEQGRPWVRLKIAGSLDGRTALPNGASQWITGPEARADGHAWRRRAGAVLTGIGTVLADDPRMDVRLVPTMRQPLRVVLDPRGRLPATARVLQPPGAALVFTGVTAEHAATAWRAQGAEVQQIALDASGRCSLPDVMAEMARRSVNELHVEAGPTLNGALLREGLVDEVLLYLAPRLLGEGRPLAALGPWERLADSIELKTVACTPIGNDLCLRLRLPANGRVEPAYTPRQ